VLHKPVRKMRGKCLLFREHGEPARVVHLAEESIPAPGPGEALVRMLAAPINPSDLNVIEGTYPVQPELPAVPGGEGVGVIARLGIESEPWREGDLVLLPPRVGTWRKGCVVRVADLIAVPKDVPVDQAAMLRINPPTAWQMLRSIVLLQPGDWIIQNAANSGVGRAVIQLARHMRIRTINLVRRANLVSELTNLGGDVVLMDDESTTSALKRASGGAPIHLALNAVGGESALRVTSALARGGTMVTYGAMAQQPIRIPNRLLIFEDIRFQGFWITKWYEQSSAEARIAMFRELFPLVAQEILKLPIDTVYPIEDSGAALNHAQQGKRKGKILFRLAE
jgi:trans-2-enoyl-CoA reductase